MITILIVEDVQDDADMIVRDINRPTAASELFGGGVAVRVVRTIAEASDMIAAGSTDCVLLDLHLPDASSLDGLKSITTQFPHIPVVVVSGVDDELLGKQCIDNGAQEYLIKGTFPARALQRVVSYAISRKNYDELVMEIKSALVKHDQKMSRINKVSQQIQDFKSTVEKLAPAETLSGGTS